ncbi:MAG: hypothetical protein COV70_00840 [Parcubacteria group bacterium CG11_big_fil_rev_8_21_14_0_20_39_22]|nr:MAG: hypothetical protein COV70_00840 [Parcubacteria group bacterium CG11_big_fil_rev_8_21_14_0_20_39_22]
MKKISDIKNHFILLDTNIPIFYSSKGFKERSGNILRLLVDNGNKLAMSEITTLELLKEEQDKDVADYHYAFINYTEHMTRLPVDKNIIQNAIVLANEYRRVCNQKKVNYPDLIIGGTVVGFSEKSDVLLMTSDRRDFCEPLWETVAYQCVLKDDKEKVDANIYLLKFNNKIILDKYRNGDL